MRKSILLLIAVISFCLSQAQYTALLIADSLKKDARAVKRLEEVIFEIKSPAKAKLHKHEVYTILNENGVNFGMPIGRYEKFESINYLDAKLYNEFGKEVKKVKTKDLIDVGGSGDETLMTDTRYKYYDFGYRNYPYTVETEQDDDINGMMSIDNWHPQSATGVSVEESKYVIIAPKDYTLRYKAFNYNKEPVITEDGDKKTYTWEIKNLTAKKYEAFSPDLQEITPNVMFAPSLFEAQGYSGDMTTWQSYGKFIYDLLKDRDALPDDIKKKVHDLTDTIKDTRKKIYALYDYMQKNTRYISIQLGIGGLQPFDANFVATKRYGDCKALSNYMVALLKEAGIKANSLSIQAGEDATDIVTDFPCHQFNHRIACVSLGKDTVWLECTDQTLPPGYMGSFTGNRKALLIDENGGHLVDTKKYTANDNLEVTRLTGDIDNAGKLTATITTSYAGYSYFINHRHYTDLTKDKQLERLKEEINLPTYEVTSFQYDDHKSENPTIDERVQVASDAAVTLTGKRLFFTPNFLSQNGTRLLSSEDRKYDVVYKNDFTYIDSMEYKLPQGYSVEAMAKDVVINNKFGVYEIHFKIDGEKLTVSRKYVRTSGRYPPSEYNNLVKFYDDMYKADRSKIVFVKKD